MRAAVAQHPAAADDVVLALAHDDSTLVRASAASNVVDRPALEAPLSRSPDRWVRAIVAHTYAARTEASLLRVTQETLADDDFRETRARIAETTNYLDLFERLMADPHPRARGACAANPRATRHHIATLLRDPSRITRTWTVGAGLDVSDQQLLAAAQDRSADVRWAALTRAGAPLEAIADSLRDDPDDNVRHHARVALAGQTLAEPAAEQEEVARRAATSRLRFMPWPQD